MVFYRKYRPQKISELDSEPVRVSLANILSAKEPPHALLFTGPKGLGKTSAARIVAKIVNCSAKQNKPCNKCGQCVSITNGTNLDILEIDAASNRGIEEIRDLREKIKLAPSAARKKVYIIDEVHMLTPEAFNALLKTLEEPPSHAMFILCTTEVHKVPKTIASRCFHIVFKNATGQELERSLKRIISMEKINMDQEALAIIAKNADGSFRDGAKILEQAVLAVGRKKITGERILALLGSSKNGLEIFEALKEKNAGRALNWLNEAVAGGLNIKSWLEETLAVLHTVLLFKYDIKEGEVNDEVLQFTQEELKKLIMLFSKAHQELRLAVIAQLPVELAIIEYCMEEGVPA
ncbi:DNA polymerase III subunit gamma/tau [Candidatus Microgenomates bacterium]|nr:DNA polymerase III subunit gamma/tau [Candidatus Microgenomates bacterium]